MKNITKVKQELLKLKAGVQLANKVFLTQDELAELKKYLENNKNLPDGIAKDYDSGLYFRYEEDKSLSHEEIVEYVLLKQNDKLHTIRTCMIFFTILTIIGLAISIALAS